MSKAYVEMTDEEFQVATGLTRMSIQISDAKATLSRIAHLPLTAEVRAVVSNVETAFFHLEHALHEGRGSL